MKHIIFAALKLNIRHMNLCLDMIQNSDNKEHWRKQLDLTVSLNERIKMRWKRTILENVIFIDFKTRTRKVA